MEVASGHGHLFVTAASRGGILLATYASLASLLGGTGGESVNNQDIH